jgi:hypothetical protein
VGNYPPSWDSVLDAFFQELIEDGFNDGARNISLLFSATGTGSISIHFMLNFNQTFP